MTDLVPHLEVAYWRAVAPYGFRMDEAELNIMVERLLDVDRPITAFNALSHEYERVDATVLARLMRALTQPTAEQASDVQLHPGNISDALEALSASGQATVAELAQLEYLFIQALSHSRHGIPNLERQIEESPGDFAHLVSLLSFALRVQETARATCGQSPAPQRESEDYYILSMHLLQ